MNFSYGYFFVLSTQKNNVFEINNIASNFIYCCFCFIKNNRYFRHNAPIACSFFDSSHTRCICFSYGFVGIIGSPSPSFQSTFVYCFFFTNHYNAIWSIALMYNALKVSGGAKGIRLTVGFIIGLIVAEFISKILTNIVFSQL